MDSIDKVKDSIDKVKDVPVVEAEQVIEEQAGIVQEQVNIVQDDNDNKKSTTGEFTSRAAQPRTERSARSDDIKNTAKCPKCGKIKVLFDTEKGRMCDQCKIRRGL